MGTFGLGRDTRNPFKKGLAMLNNIGLGHLMSARWQDDKTLTQAEADQMVADAVAKAKTTGFDGFAPDVKEHPSIKRYKSTEELAKGHIELEKKIGLKGVLVPSEGSSDQVKTDFFKAIGRPDTSDLYANPSLENLHEGVKSTSEQDLKAFKDKAFEIGLSSGQFNALYDWYLKLQSQRLTDYDKTLEDEKNQAATTLRQKLGAKYDESLALANGLIKKFGSEALMEEIGSNPDAIEFLIKIGSLLSEDKLGDLGRSGMGMTPEAAKLEINKIMQTIMATDPSDPIYQDLLKKKDSLYKIAYPTTPPA